MTLFQAQCEQMRGELQEIHSQCESGELTMIVGTVTGKLASNARLQFHAQLQLCISLCEPCIQTQLLWWGSTRRMETWRWPRLRNSSICAQCVHSCIATCVGHICMLCGLCSCQHSWMYAWMHNFLYHAFAAMYSKFTNFVSTMHTLVLVTVCDHCNASTLTNSCIWRSWRKILRRREQRYFETPTLAEEGNAGILYVCVPKHLLICTMENLKLHRHLQPCLNVLPVCSICPQQYSTLEQTAFPLFAIVFDEWRHVQLCSHKGTPISSDHVSFPLVQCQHLHLQVVELDSSLTESRRNTEKVGGLVRLLAVTVVRKVLCACIEISRHYSYEEFRKVCICKYTGCRGGRGLWSIFHSLQYHSSLLELQSENKLLLAERDDTEEVSHQLFWLSQATDYNWTFSTCV